MSKPDPISIQDDEILARFVMCRDWVRSDGTVRPDAFIPPRDLNLSTTRHLELTESGLWKIGVTVAAERDLELVGRADLTVRGVTSVGLAAEAAPIPENPNHAHVTGWPQDKPARKSLAHQLAVMSEYLSKS